MGRSLVRNKTKNQRSKGQVRAQRATRKDRAHARSGATAAGMQPTRLTELHFQAWDLNLSSGDSEPGPTPPLLAFSKDGEGPHRAEKTQGPHRAVKPQSQRSRGRGLGRLRSRDFEADISV